MDGWPNVVKRHQLNTLEILVATLAADVATLTATVASLQTTVTTVITDLQTLQITLTSDTSSDVAVVAANTQLNTMITNLKAALPK